MLANSRCGYANPVLAWCQLAKVPIPLSLDTARGHTLPATPTRCQGPSGCWRTGAASRSPPYSPRGATWAEGCQGTGTGGWRREAGAGVSALAKGWSVTLWRGRRLSNNQQKIVFSNTWAGGVAVAFATNACGRGRAGVSAWPLVVPLEASV